MTVEINLMISLHKCMGQVWDPTRDPWIAVRHVSAARHITDCAMRAVSKQLKSI